MDDTPFRPFNPSDFPQVESGDRVVNATVTIKQVLTNIKTNIQGGTSGEIADVTANKELKVSATVSSSALPTDAATATKQDEQTALLTTIDADTSSLANNINVQLSTIATEITQLANQALLSGISLNQATGARQSAMISLQTSLNAIVSGLYSVAVHTDGIVTGALDASISSVNTILNTLATSANLTAGTAKFQRVDGLGTVAPAMNNATNAGYQRLVGGGGAELTIQNAAATPSGTNIWGLAGMLFNSTSSQWNPMVGQSPSATTWAASGANNVAVLGVAARMAAWDVSGATNRFVNSYVLSSATIATSGYAPAIINCNYGYNGTNWIPQAVQAANASTSTSSNVTLVQQVDKYGVSGEAADFCLDAARGRIANVSVVNKFGHAPTGVQTSATDIWSRADATPTQQIWLAPTAARVHAIVSTSTDDDGSPVGLGARTIRIYGLQTWASAESSEDITMNGVTSVNTANSYVIIHRMKVLTCGASGPNVGTITATAAAPDSTVTAVILAGDGQTEMAIYGVPSTQALYLTEITASMNSSIATDRIDITLKVNENPDVQTTAFLSKGTFCIQNSGSSANGKRFCPYNKIAGPAIVKIQGVASTNDTDCAAFFDGFLATG